MGSRIINIMYNDKKLSVTVQGDKLRKLTLSDNFPPGHLTYGDHTFLLETDDTYVYLNPTENNYVYIEADVSSQAKKPKRYEEMLARMRGRFLNDKKTKLSEKKISNKKQQIHSPQSKQEEESEPKTRKVYAYWKHKPYLGGQYEKMVGPMGRKQQLNLEKLKKYSVSDLKELLLSKFREEEESQYFLDNSVVQIGNSKGIVIKEFLDLDENPCDFWKYVKLHKMQNSSHYIVLNLLTTRIKANNTPTIPLQLSESLEKILNKESVRLDITTPGTENKVPKINQVLMISESSKENVETESSSRKLSNCQETIHGDPVLSLSQKNSDSVNNINKRSMTQNSPAKRIASNPVFENKSREENQVLSSLVTDKPMNSVLMNKTNRDKTIAGFTSESDGDDDDQDLKNLQALKLSIPIVDVDKIKLNTKKRLGKGAQGCVYKGNFLGSDVAVKVLPKYTNNRQVYKEIQLLNNIRHCNIIDIWAVALTGTQFYIVTEFYDSYSLNHLIFNPEKCSFGLSTNNRLEITTQICKALVYLHERDQAIAHRDIKPANILVNKFMQVKVCDLGIGKCDKLQTELLTTRPGVLCGTLMYIAPEIFLDKDPATVSCDVWSFGCTITELFTNAAVWDTKGHTEVYTCVLSNLKNRNIPDISMLPPALHEPTNKCFVYDPNQRIKMTEFLSYLH